MFVDERRLLIDRMFLRTFSAFAGSKPAPGKPLRGASWRRNGGGRSAQPRSARCVEDDHVCEKQPQEDAHCRCASPQRPFRESLRLGAEPAAERPSSENEETGTCRPSEVDQPAERHSDHGRGKVGRQERSDGRNARMRRAASTAHLDDMEDDEAQSTNAGAGDACLQRLTACWVLSA